MEKPSLNAEKHGLYCWYLQHLVHLFGASSAILFTTPGHGIHMNPRSHRFCWGKGYPLVNEHRLLEIAIEMVYP